MHACISVVPDQANNGKVGFEDLFTFAQFYGDINPLTHISNRSVRK